MKEIDLIGLNEKIYVHEHPSGLKTYMWVNDKVNSCFMSLTALYGSIHTEFKIANKKYRVPDGVAHFLEHIKFNENEDTTAHDYYYKSGADVNAFTTFEYTSYLCFTTTNIKENLAHLIDFVYNPYFTKKIIAKEKPIIIEESNMVYDDAYNNAFYHHLNNLFHNYKYNRFITGTEEDIKKITLDDIELVYNNFYHPHNMFLTLTGNFNPYEMGKVIDEALDKKEFPKFLNPEIIMKKEPKEVVKSYEEINLNVSDTRLRYGIKIPKTKFKKYDDLTLKLLLSIFVSVNFGDTSDLKQELIWKGLATSLSSSVEFFDNYIVICINALTDYPEEIINIIKAKFNDLDLSEEAFNRKKKACIASLILDFDDVENVNLKIQDNIINYGSIVSDAKERYENITWEMVQDLVADIDFSNASVLVVKPYPDKENNNLEL